MKQKIIEIIKHNVPMIIAVAIILSGILLIVSFRGSSPLGGRSGTSEILGVTTSTLTNANLTDFPIISGPAILHSIGIGKTGEQVALFDSTSGTANDSIIFFVTSSSAQMWLLDLNLDYGLMINTTDQSRVMIFYTPK